VVGERPADFTLYEDDGVTTGYLHGKQNRVVLHAGDKPSVTRTGNYQGPERYRITAWKEF
ncbi:MAG: DUF5110 domain-containing protein, partial [Limisphaerales bacterium]